MIPTETPRFSVMPRIMPTDMPQRMGANMPMAVARVVVSIWTEKPFALPQVWAAKVFHTPLKKKVSRLALCVSPL